VVLEWLYSNFIGSVFHDGSGFAKNHSSPPLPNFSTKPRYLHYTYTYTLLFPGISVHAHIPPTFHLQTFT
jgi:hypothetical protein